MQKVYSLDEVSAIRLKRTCTKCGATPGEICFGATGPFVRIAADVPTWAGVHVQRANGGSDA